MHRYGVRKNIFIQDNTEDILEKSERSDTGNILNAFREAISTTESKDII